jgi:3-keto-5-aminohexanoate cleavage enzyme
VADPAIITAAVTGSITSSAQTPYVPLTVEAIADAAVESWQAGAAVIHLHAREDAGTPTQDPEIYDVLVRRIRATGCDAILNLSTGSAGGRAELDERLGVLELAPELATLDCGSMNYGDDRVFANPMSFLRRAAGRMRDLGVVPEIEAFDPSMIHNGLRLIEEGLIDGPGVWQLCLGVAGGVPADLATIAHMLGRLPVGAVWSLLGVGRHQVPVNVLSLAWGGHVRTGLEDNIYYRRGELATSTAQLVRRVVRLAEEVGRPVATPAQARELLGVRAGAGAS